MEATCELACDEEADCDELAGTYSCDRGLCRQQHDDCSDKSAPQADEFIILGDRFLANNGQVTVELEQLMTVRNALSPGDSLRDYSSGVVSPFGGAEDLFSQYALAEADGAARIVILNAGGPDALLDCDVSSSELCPNLQNAKAGAERLFNALNEDGVEHVILFIYPRPDDTSLAEKFTLLEDSLRDVCATSPVACHFLPLAPLFEERRETLLTGMGLFPTEDGAVVTAGAIFGALRERCIVP